MVSADASTPPHASENVKWLLLAIVAYSYPLAALFGDSDGSLSLVVVPTIIALAISALCGLALSSMPYKIWVIAISASILLFNGAVWILSDFVDPQKMLVFNGVLFIFGFLLALSLGAPPILENLDRALMTLGVIALLVLLTNINEFDAGRLTYGDSNPIWMGRLFGMSCMAALYGMIRGRVSPAVAITLLLPLFIAMTATGSRGPVFAFILASGVAFLINPIRNKYPIMVAAFFALSIIVLFVEVTGKFGGIRGLSFGEADDVSYFIRLNMFDYTRYIISEFKEGIGVGAFSFMNFTYPHNIVLELLAEWGWAAGGAYIALFLVGGLGLYYAGPKVQFLLLLFIFDFTNACLSGDITSPRLLYGLTIVGVACVLSGVRNRNGVAKTVVPDGASRPFIGRPAE
jgi:hypothetical protein